MCFGGKKGNHFWCAMYPRFVDFFQCLEFYPAPEGKRRIFSLQMRKTEVHRSEMACPSHTPLDRRDGASAPGKDRDRKNSDDHAP